MQWWQRPIPVRMPVARSNICRSHVLPERGKLARLVTGSPMWKRANNRYQRGRKIAIYQIFESNIVDFAHLESLPRRTLVGAESGFCTVHSLPAISTWLWRNDV